MLTLCFFDILKVFPWMGKRQIKGRPLGASLFRIFLKRITSAVRWGKEIKSLKEEIKKAINLISICIPNHLF